MSQFLDDYERAYASEYFPLIQKQAGFPQMDLSKVMPHLPLGAGIAGGLAAGKIFKGKDENLNIPGAIAGGLGAGYLAKRYSPQIEAWLKTLQAAPSGTPAAPTAPTAPAAPPSAPVVPAQELLTSTKPQTKFTSPRTRPGPSLKPAAPPIPSRAAQGLLSAQASQRLLTAGTPSAPPAVPYEPSGAIRGRVRANEAGRAVAEQARGAWTAQSAGREASRILNQGVYGRGLRGALGRALQFVKKGEDRPIPLTSRVFAGAVKRAPYVGAAAGALAAGKIFKNEDGSFNPVAAGLGGLGAGYLTKQLHPKIQQWASNPGNVGAEAARAVGAPPVAGTPTPKPTSNFQDILKQRMDAQKRLALKQKGVPNAALMPAERLQSKAVNPRIAQAQAERLMGREALHQTGIKYQALPNLSKEQLSGLAQGEASTLSGLQRLRGAARIKASGRVGGFLRRLATKHAEDKVRGVLRGRR